MIRRTPYCRDRMCGATDCSTCYGPGFDREGDEADDEPSDLDEPDEDEAAP